MSHVVSDEANVAKGMSPEESREFDDLCRRYDHFGGERVQWIFYHWRRAPAAVLAVGRAKDEFLQKILALCPANFAMKALSLLFGADSEVIDLGVLGGALLVRIRAEDGSLKWAGLDLSQAFTSITVPRWFWFWQAGPRMKPAEVPPQHRDPAWPPDAKIRPCYKRAAMRGMYSALWLMALVFQAIRRTLACTPELRTFKVANLREVRLSGVGLRSSEGVIIVHVDDIAVCHKQQQLANRNTSE